MSAVEITAIGQKPLVCPINKPVPFSFMPPFRLTFKNQTCFAHKGLNIMANQYKDNMEFEAEVRRIAEVIWSLEPGECQPNHYSDNPTVKELDGLARLRDCTHLLMVTTSTKLDKVKSDVKKLGAAEAVEKKPIQQYQNG